MYLWSVRLLSEYASASSRAVSSVKHDEARREEDSGVLPGGSNETCVEHEEGSTATGGMVWPGKIAIWKSSGAADDYGAGKAIP
mmetsp:Transcript_41084/g.162393  ORF Transcript_41084/g.162393 Transcript_41084/m.162393 type:complete len:84 (-) Transcript_41084:336-587(-)